MPWLGRILIRAVRCSRPAASSPVPHDIGPAPAVAAWFCLAVGRAAA
jgi:hypothetical protein